MKTKLHLLAFLLVTFTGAFAQVTKLNSNQSLMSSFAMINNKAVLVSEIDSTLWVTDATVGGTIQLSPDIKFTGGGDVLNNKLIFSARTDATGAELYITDGTVAGTVLLKDIYPGSASSLPDEDFARLNGFLYFTAATPTEGRELWKTDGTTGGTVLVKDIVPGTAGSNEKNDYDLFSTDDYLLLNVKTALEGNELWKSDGTAAGTNLLKDINAGTASSDAGSFRKLNNIVLFSATSAATGTELFRTDGTPAGTQLIKDISAGASNAFDFLFFLPFNGKLFFKARSLTEGDEIWVTDGTTANTQILKDIEAGPVGSFSSLFSAITVGNKIIFSAFNSASGFELWQSDGTAAGTTIFKDIVPGPESSMAFIYPSFDYVGGTTNQPLFNGKFFLSATTEDEGNELWISDGTPGGTVMVKDINPGEEDGIENVSFIYTNTGLYFTANNGTDGHQLWKSDGTAPGTVQVSRINMLGDADIFFMYSIVNNKILFTATDGDHMTATDLFRIDADVILPVKLINFTAASRGADALLQWSTENELNSKDFTIERSFDGRIFAPVGSVNAAGTSGSKRTYNFTDAGVFNTAGVVYYRLKMNDRDGASETTKSIALKAGENAWTIKLNTNPVSSFLSFTLSGNKQVSITIKDMAGKAMLVKNGMNLHGINQVDVSSFAPGIYILTAEGENERKAIRFVKQ